MTNPMSSPFVMIVPMKAISVLERPLQRFCSVDFIGLPFFKTLIPIALLISVARSYGVFIDRI
jgi:hypothetical protein